jgi:hypothetical protein
VAEFVDQRFTRRLQFDFTDVTTSPLARRWAERCERVLYIEDPHPRAVRDANRPNPDDLLAGLREAFGRLREAGEGGRPSLAGVDAVRPVTFGYLPVYREPRDEVEWDRLGEALRDAGAQGIDRYEAERGRLIEQVVEAKSRRLAALDLASLSPEDRHSATTLLVLSIHDTMNHTARPDGAICVERKPEDRLPNVVALSNRGDAEGNDRGEDEPPSLDPVLLRRLGDAYRDAFDAHGPDDVAYNRPYLGGHETTRMGPWLRELAVGTGLTLGAWQNEFCREFLLGEANTAELMAPGDGWPEVDQDRNDWLAERLVAAHEAFRR